MAAAGGCHGLPPSTACGTRENTLLPFSPWCRPPPSAASTVAGHTRNTHAHASYRLRLLCSPTSPVAPPRSLMHQEMTKESREAGSPRPQGS